MAWSLRIWRTHPYSCLSACVVCKRKTQRKKVLYHYNSWFDTTGDIRAVPTPVDLGKYIQSLAYPGSNTRHECRSHSWFLCSKFAGFGTFVLSEPIFKQNPCKTSETGVCSQRKKCCLAKYFNKLCQTIVVDCLFSTTWTWADYCCNLNSTKAIIHLKTRFSASSQL